MDITRSLRQVSAAEAIATTFGALAGVGGLLHGIGEIRQGNVAADGFFVDSWTEGPIAEHMDGDPGLTLIQNMLATGITVTVISVIVILFALFMMRRKRAGLTLIALSVAMLLTGGGVGPPTIGILAGVAGIGIGSTHGWWREHFPHSARKLAADAWPWVFAVSAINGLYLFVGSTAIIYAFDVGIGDLTLFSFFLAFILMGLNIVTGAAFDMRSDEDIRRPGGRGIVAPG